MLPSVGRSFVRAAARWFSFLQVLFKKELQILRLHDSRLCHGVLPERRGERIQENQRRDREATTAGQAGCAQGAEAAASGHRRKRQEHIHQTDADHSWKWIFG